MNRFRKHGHFYNEPSAIDLLRNLTLFLARGPGAIPLILSGLLVVLQTTSTEDGRTPLHEAAAGNENSAVITALLI